MNPTDPLPAAPTPKKHNPLEATRDGEVQIFDVKRHPIGIIGTYLSFGFLLTVVGYVAYMAPTWLPDYDPDLVQRIALSVFLVTAVLAGIFVYIARSVYYANRWVLTDDSLTQIAAYSLFSKQNAQLGLHDIEDVVAQQDGILTHMFNYGTLRAETAGQQNKFTFPFCPDPNSYAQKILLARENFEQGQRNGERHLEFGHGPSPNPPSSPTQA